MTDLRLGDCLEVMKSIPDKSIDAIICDLPYGTTQNKWDSIINLDSLWIQYKRICKGAIVLTAQTPFDKVLGVSNFKMLKYEWIWEKTHPTGHLNAKKMPMKAHENILIFYEKLKTYNPQKTFGHLRKTATVKTNKISSVYGMQKQIGRTYDSTERYPRSVLKIASDKQTSNLHPTQKPIALMEYLIKTYTNEGETVLDNCMGSGTTGVACKNLGRKFIGIEQNANYFEIAKNRIEQY
jgi:site-specific DNA-methyltransferase (adenine-specific)